ncbi:MAG: hypothetical protein KTR31_11965 [Myxococcales bacterium]|nr:hypothetical protein [Myxococcales bacterium]
MQHAPWTVHLLGLHWTLSERTVRRLLSFGLLSGTELARRTDAEGGWAPLHDTPLFVESVAHLGDPAVTAHRRRVVRWLPLGVPLTAWLVFFAVLVVAEPPRLDELVPMLLFLAGVPALVLAVWTARFRQSFAVVRQGRREAEAPAAVPLLAPIMPDLDDRDALRDPEALRARLEVVQRLRAASKDADRIVALEREEQALLHRMVEGP